MASGLVQGTAPLNDLLALPSLEAQAMYLIVLLTSRENEYNTSNPNNLSNRATTAVNYDQKTVTGQVTLALTDSAVTGRLTENVLAFLPDGFAQ